jgi:hypothetical protein
MQKTYRGRREKPTITAQMGALATQEASAAGKGLFWRMTVDVELQADKLVRWDVAPCGLNRKQKQRFETTWHTNT